MKRFYASENPAPESWETVHTERVREMSARGMVLLEHDGTLPLRAGTRVALYGYGARHTAYCGYGAASINSRVRVNVEQGLLSAGLTVATGDYLDRYDVAIAEEEEAYFAAIRAEGGSLFERLVRMYGRQFTPVAQLPITKEDVEASGTETAIFVITRISGEGADRKDEPGDYELSEAEKENLAFLSEHYSHVIVLLNTVGAVDMAYIRSLPHLAAVLFVGLNGGVTGLAAADVLTGRVTPEGKLFSTWAERYADFPNAADFGLCDGNVDDEWYREGIYVGYRYFDSFGVKPAYPFGYGLSYTRFEMQTALVEVVPGNGNSASLGMSEANLVDGLAEMADSENGKAKAPAADSLRVQVRVKNTGHFCGREVVQLYVSCPAGGLEQPAQRLAGFAKTGLLAPGEEETVAVEADLETLASYSEEKCAWILEAGDYVLRVGNSSRSTVPAAVLRVSEEAVFEECRAFAEKSTDVTEIHPDAESGLYAGEVLPSDLPVLTWEKKTPARKPDYARRAGEEAGLGETVSGADGRKEDSKPLTFSDFLSGACTAEELACDLTLEELLHLLVGKDADAEATSTSGGALVAASDDTGVDAGGETFTEVAVGASYMTATLIKDRGIPNTPMADGGCGLRLLPEYEMDENGKLLTAGISAIKNGDRLLNEQEKAFFTNVPKGKRYWQYSTALPMSVILAQTWDPALWEEAGRIEHREMVRFGVKLWLAPGMNIHRNPLGGRNFEYYGEDPLLTGLCGASVVTGIQAGGGIGATIKHLACNNQEENRGAMNAHVSERALREIYLRGFEMAVRKAHPLAIMTGHNLVNGTNAAESYDLLTSAAREEWGFEGLVMTDWGTTGEKPADKPYGPSNPVKCALGGTDLFMPGQKSEVEKLKAAVDNGSVSLANLRWCAVNILNVLKVLWGA